MHISNRSYLFDIWERTLEYSVQLNVCVVKYITIGKISISNADLLFL